MKQVSIRIPDELLKAVKLKCIKEETNLTKVFSMLLENWVNVEQVQNPPQKQSAPISYKPTRLLMDDDDAITDDIFR